MGSFLTITLSFLFFSACLLKSFANPRDFSIIGYTEEDMTSRDSLIELFESWAVKHRKSYASFAEKLRRFEIFVDNLKHIDETNRAQTSYSLGLNNFADLSHEEFKEKYLSSKMTRSDIVSASLREGSFKYEDIEGSVSLPKSVDWREKGAVTPVRNQGQCDAGWAYAAVAAAEGINQIVTGNLTVLSAQELIDCDRDFNNGCYGGEINDAFSYIVSNGGLHTEHDYPYTMRQGKCHSTRGESPVGTITSYTKVPENSGASFLKALAHQPISVFIEPSRSFQFYRGGVFDGPCGKHPDHGVAAVGYGTSTNEDYIIVKNSWGAKWGEKGYIRMKRNTGKVEGLCGIYKMASYPTKKI